jgi:hypothetical protein
MVNILLDKHHKQLLKHAHTTLAKFHSIYKEHNGLEILPVPIAPQEAPPPASPTQNVRANADSLFAIGGLYNQAPDPTPAPVPQPNPTPPTVKSQK